MPCVTAVWSAEIWSKGYSKCMCKAQVKAVKAVKPVLQTFGALRAVANHGNDWSIEQIL